MFFAYGTITLYGYTFQNVLLNSALAHCSPTTPSASTGFALLRFRSPLLTQSLLISFPEGTKMFQFPSFAPTIGNVYLYTLGCPIRKSTDQSFLTAPRSLSQSSTSFIAFTSQGIHHSLFVAYLLLLILKRITSLLKFLW